MDYLKPDNPLLVIIGPSGSGKSTVIRLLATRGIIEVTPTWTTRPPRPGETDESIEHCFISDGEYSQRVDGGFFIESVRMFHLPYRYGLPRIPAPPPGRVATIMLRATLLPLAGKHYNNFHVYQVEDSAERIAHRLRERLAYGEELGSRLDDVETELAAGRNVANRIFINNNAIAPLATAIETAIHEDFPV